MNENRNRTSLLGGAFAIVFVAGAGCSAPHRNYEGSGGSGGSGGGGHAPETAATDSSASGADAGPDADTGCKVPEGGAVFNDAIAIAAGSTHSCAIRQDGALYCWGDNAFGQLGVPQATSLASPKPLKVQFPASLGDARITHVELGEKTTYAIDAELRLWVFGNNEAGYRADGTADAAPHAVPQMVSLSPGGPPMLVRAVAPLWYSVCALTTTGEIDCWGKQNLDEIGRAHV